MVHRNKATLLLLVGWVGTLVWIAGATSGAVAIQPSLLWMGGCAALLLVILLLQDRSEKIPAIVVGCASAIVIGLGAGHILLKDGFPYTQDGGSHLWALYGIYRSIGDGWLPGRWVADLGLGIPLLLHHGPLPYLPGLLLIKSGFTVYDAFKITLLLSFIASSATMYLSAWRATGRRDAALIAAVAFAFAPYHLLDSHYRGALGESVALIAVPVFLEAVLALVTGRDPRAARRLLLATLWLALSHLMTFFTAATGAGVGILVWWAQGRERPPLRWTIPVLLGTALAALWIVPGILEVNNTSFPLLDNSRPPRFGEHGLFLTEIFSRRLWFGRLPSYLAADQAPGTNLEMPFYFGIPLIVGMAILAIVGRGGRRTPCTRREENGWILVGLVTLGLTLLPVARIASAWPGFPQVQFAWRYLGIASAAAAMGLGLLVAHLASRLEHRAVFWTFAPSLLIGAALLFDVFPFTGAPDWVPPYESVVHFYRTPAGSDGSPLFQATRHAIALPISAGAHFRVSGLEFPPARPDVDVQLVRGLYSEYLTPTVYRWLAQPPDLIEACRRAGVQWAFAPVAARPIEITDSRPWATLESSEGQQALAEDRGTEGSHFEVNLPPAHASGKLRLLEQAGPGWEVSVDGGSWQAVSPDPEGLMQVAVPENSRQVHFRYGFTTLPRKLGLLISALAMVLTAAAVFWRRRGDVTIHVRLANFFGELSENNRDRLILIVVASIAFGFRLWYGSLENGTDAIYADAIRDLVTRGDWLAPSVHGSPYLMKPPLFFWLDALVCHILGLTDLAFRLPSAFGALLGVVATFEIGRRLGGRRLGWLAAAVLICCAPFYEFSRRVYMDTLLSGLTAATAAAYLAGLENRRWLWWGGVFSGLAILTKSYAGVFATCAFFGYVVIARRDLLRDWRLWGSFVVAVLIPLPWVFSELMTNREVFLSQNLDVFRLSNEAQFSWHPARRFFYPLSMWEHDPVFSLLTVTGAGLALNHLRQGKNKWWIPLLWFAVPLCLYWNLSQQRLYYMLPLLPAAALLGSLTLERLLPRSTPESALIVAFLALFFVNAAPSVALEGNVLDPSPGTKVVAERAAAVMPPSSQLFVWNDFFAAPELYSGRLATQLSPSKSLVEEIGRILVVGRLGIARFVQAPQGIWELYQSTLEQGGDWYLLIQDSELDKLSPGMAGARILDRAEGWNLVSSRATGSSSDISLASRKATVDAYLAASKFFAQNGRFLEGAGIMAQLANQHPESASKAWKVAGALFQQAGAHERADEAFARARALEPHEGGETLEPHGGALEPHEGGRVIEPAEGEQ